MTVTTTTKQVDAKEFATLMGVNQATIYKRAIAAKIPAPVKLNGKMMWDLEGVDLDAVKQVMTAPKIVRVSVESKPEPDKVEKPAVVNISVVGPIHYQFKRLLNLVQRRRHTYLVGPMGSGKSHAAEQIANSLGLYYAYVSLNPQSSSSLLMGFIDAQGRYVSTEFYNCYKNGGLYNIDELDNCGSSLLTTLNSAIANGSCAFPCGIVKKHPNFVLCATGNTDGRGGNWQYPERRKIDEATLDRLTFVDWQYDEALENSIVANIGTGAIVAPWVSFIRRVRKFVCQKENGIKGGVYATPRSMFAGADDLVNSDFTVADIADSLVFKGLDKDVKTRILNVCPLPVIARQPVSKVA